MHAPLFIILILTITMLYFFVQWRKSAIIQYYTDKKELMRRQAALIKHTCMGFLIAVDPNDEEFTTDHPELSAFVNQDVFADHFQTDDDTLNRLNEEMVTMMEDWEEEIDEFASKLTPKDSE